MSAMTRYSESLSSFGLSSYKRQTGLLIRVSAPGKVILHGEHSVVYGKLAIAASLGLRTKLSLTEVATSHEESKLFSIQLKNLNLEQSYDIAVIQEDLLRKSLALARENSRFSLENPKLVNHEKLLQIAEQFVAKHCASYSLNSYQNIALSSLFYLLAGILGSSNTKVNPIHLVLATDLTISAGTGSSASYLVSLAAAFLQYAKVRSSSLGNQYMTTDLQKFEKKDLELISDWAKNAERIVHGPASGVDNTICTYGSMVEFRKDLPPKVIHLTIKFRVLLVNSLISRDTKSLVAKVAETKKEHPHVIGFILDAMDKVTQSALDTIAHLNELENQRSFAQGNLEQEIKADYRRLGELADMNENLLVTLGVSHPTLDLICLTLKEAGLHGKLTGAGGGGYAIALVPPYYPEKRLQLLLEKLESQKFVAQLTDLGGPGVTLDEFRLNQ